MKERIKQSIERLAQTSTPEQASEIRMLPGNIDVTRVSLAVLALIAVIFALDQAQPIFIPIVLAIVVSYALYPFSSGLARLGVPRFLAVTIVVLGMLALLAAGAWGLSDDVSQVIDDLPTAAQTLRSDLRTMRNSGNTSIEKVQKAAEQVNEAAEEAGGENPPPDPGVARVQIQRDRFDLRDYIWWGSLGIVGAGAQLIVVLVMVFLMLYSGDSFKYKLVAIAGPEFTARRNAVTLLEAINGQIRRYLLVLMVSALFVGVLSWIAFVILGFEQAAVWAIVAGILSAVPFIGPTIAFFGISVMAYVQYEAVSMALLLGVVSLVITSIQGFILLPWLTSRATQINVLSLIVGMLFWGWLWGPWGVAFAHPILMIFKAVCDHIESLRPLAVLLSLPDDRQQPVAIASEPEPAREEQQSAAQRADTQTADSGGRRETPLDDDAQGATTPAG